MDRMAVPYAEIIALYTALMSKIDHLIDIETKCFSKNDQFIFHK